MHPKKILILKRMVQDLLYLYPGSLEPLEAIERIRDLVERAAQNPDIPLEYYELQDQDFLESIMVE